MNKTRQIIIGIPLALIIFFGIAFLSTIDGVNDNNNNKSKSLPIVKVIYDYKVLVTHVVDGDTIDLANGERIRLAIVNTPERGQTGYKEATEFTKKLCLGKQALINLDTKQGQSYNRIIAVVYCSDDNNDDKNYKMLNKELLIHNLAVVDKRFCGKSEFTNILCV